MRPISCHRTGSRKTRPSIVKSGIIVLSLLGAHIAAANTSNVSDPDAAWLKKVPGYTIPKDFKFQDNYSFLTKDQMHTLLSSAKKEANRKVAADESGEKISETELSPELRKFITEFTAARTAQDLEKLLVEAD